MNKKFAVGQVYTIKVAGKELVEKKITKVTGKSVYFGKTRVDIEIDRDGDQYLVTDEGSIGVVEDDVMEEEDDVMEEMNTVEVVEDSIEVEESVEVKTPDTVEYLLVKSTRNLKEMDFYKVTVSADTKFDKVYEDARTYPGSFVALMTVEKLERYFEDGTTRGIVQTVRDITKKYQRVMQKSGPELDFDLIRNILDSFGNDTKTVLTREEPAEEPAEESTAA